MYDFVLFLHLLAVIFAIGPLAHAVTTASRGLRLGDAYATAAAARTASLYAKVSLLVIVIGFGLLSIKDPGTGAVPGQFTDLWVWLSVLLWVVAVGLTLGVVVPTLERATETLGSGGAVTTLTGKVAGTGGAIALIFAVIVALMVFKP